MKSFEDRFEAVALPASAGPEKPRDPGS